MSLPPMALDQSRRPGAWWPCMPFNSTLLIKLWSKPQMSGDSHKTEKPEHRGSWEVGGSSLYLAQPIRKPLCANLSKRPYWNPHFWWVTAAQHTLPGQTPTLLDPPALTDATLSSWLQAGWHHSGFPQFCGAAWQSNLSLSPRLGTST